MPELPEVEIARRNLLRWFERRQLVRAEAERTRVVRSARPEDLETLRGKLVSLERRGKYLLFEFEGGRGLVGHLGMTGKFVKRPAGEEVPYSRVRFVLDTGDVIHYRDPRLFGQMLPLPAGQLRESKPLRQLGIDPLVDGLTPQTLAAAVRPSRAPLKVALMDQGRVCGLGNIHAAEALFRAHLHPSRLPASLSDEDWERLCRAILDGLTFAIEEQGSEEIRYVEEPGAQNPFLVYGRSGSPCSRCRATVQSFTQGGRTTHFCPKCQPAPRRVPARRTRSRRKSR